MCDKITNKTRTYIPDNNNFSKYIKNHSLFQSLDYRSKC